MRRKRLCILKVAYLQVLPGGTVYLTKPSLCDVREVFQVFPLDVPLRADPTRAR
jgi:hypothetical protein